MEGVVQYLPVKTKQQIPQKKAAGAGSAPAAAAAGGPKGGKGKDKDNAPGAASKAPLKPVAVLKKKAAVPK